MKVAIIGAGKLGIKVATALLGGDHEITVIDTSEEKLNKLSQQMDVLTVLGSFFLAAEVIFEKYVLHDTPSGWATLVILLAFFGGLQIFCLGIIGEYLGQIFQEVKARPRYLKEKEII